MIIPNIHHGHHPPRHPKQPLREPHGIPLEVEFLQFILHLHREIRMTFRLRVLRCEPLLEENRIPHDGIVVDLIAPPEHHVERFRLVTIQDIPPEGIRAGEGVRVDGEGEAVAGVEQDVHRFPPRGNPKGDGGALVDAVGDARLDARELHFDIEAPEGVVAFGEEAGGADLAVTTQFLPVTGADAGFVLKGDGRAGNPRVGIPGGTQHAGARGGVQSRIVLLPAEIHLAGYIMDGSYVSGTVSTVEGGDGHDRSTTYKARPVRLSFTCPATGSSASGGTFPASTREVDGG